MNSNSQQRVAVITGASSGIGFQAARLLLRQGWKVICVGRNPQRCEQAGIELNGIASEKSQAVMICADLAIMSETGRAAREIGQLTSRIDLLLNNAGGLTATLSLTREGNENTFASNHLGHFLLTQLLLPKLRAAAESSPPGSTRIINVSSSAHTHCDGLDWNDLQMIEHFSSNPAYCRVKLATMLYTRELAKRLKADGIAVHAVHPGVVASNFFSHGDEMMQGYFAKLGDTAITPEQAADDLIWVACAAEPGRATGKYYAEREAIDPSLAAQDDEAALRLWQESEKLIANTLNQ